MQDSAGQVPLALAVSATLATSGSEQASALDAVRSLLTAGLPDVAFDVWRSDECQLAGRASDSSQDVSVVDLVELLLEAGADLPWHPLSLRSGVDACDLEVVRSGLEKLGKNAAFAVNVVNPAQRSLLHSCADNVGCSGAVPILRLLLEHSAQVDSKDRRGEPSPLSIAVDAGIGAPEGSQADVQNFIMALLIAGACGGEAETWRSEDCMLAGAASTSHGNGIAEMLLEFGADLPWHPLSLQSGVRSCDALLVQNAIKRLGDHAVIAVNTLSVSGCTPLHTCAANAASIGAADICRSLIRCLAKPSEVDLGGKVPLELAVAAAINAEGSHVSLATATNTVRILLENHQAPHPEEWLLETGALAQAAKTLSGKAVVELLTEHGVELPWYTGSVDRIREECTAYGIPADKLGFEASSNVLRECGRWREMSAKELRLECQSRKLSTGDCIEKSEIISRLRKVRIQEETDVADHPELKHVGTWCYGKTATSYNITRDADGNLHFDGPHSTCGRLSGMFRLKEDGWMEAQLWGSNGIHVGIIRMSYFDKDRTMLSNFKSGTMSEWGRDIIARKQVDLPVTQPAPEPNVATQPAAEDEPKAQSEANAESSEEDVEAEIIDIADDPDLEGAFMKAVSRHDLSAATRGMERARQEAESEPEEDVEALVCAMDIDGNTMLHHCMAGPTGPGSGSPTASLSKLMGARIAEMLLEAQADVNAPNLLGETPLLAAVRAPGVAPLEIVRVLLSARAEPGHVDALAGETALMEAACRGEVELCQVLIDGGADPAQKNLHGLTARDLAAESGHKAVTRLLRAVCPPTFSDEVVQKSKPLWEAVEASDVEAVQVALDSLGDDADAVMEMTNGVQGGGRTLLHVCSANAALDDAGEIARLLLERSAKLDIQDLSGQLPLALAVTAGITAQENHYAAMDTIRVLLNAGAPVDVENWLDRDSDLARAAQTQTGSAICKLLDAFGADLPWLGLSAQREQPDEEGDSSADQITAQCTEQGIPIEAVGASGARRILCDCDRWRSMRVVQLREECDLQNLATSDCVEKSDFVARLRQVRIWEEMPRPSLEKECMSRGISIAYDYATREELEEALRGHVYGVIRKGGRMRSQCAAKGIPVDRISLDDAVAIFNEMKRLEGSKVSLAGVKHQKKRGLCLTSLRLSLPLENVDLHPALPYTAGLVAWALGYHRGRWGASLR